MTDELPDKVETLKADDRGRVNLGIEFANKTVKVSVIEVEDEE
ncbi:hypothetical protein [Natrialba taiwanensis]|nr:hypothetical protein [Natrialba taiwanensis]